MPDYRVTIKDNSINIYINDLLHLSLRRDILVGFQSWINGDKIKKYCIEYYTETGRILSEYDEKEKWIGILKELDTASGLCYGEQL